MAATTSNSAARALTRRTMETRMEKSFTVRMDALVLRPVAGRAPHGAHGLREGFWWLGRSFRIDACVGRRRWNDDVERVRKGRPTRLGFGQRHRDAARAAGRAAAALAGGRSAALVIRCRRSELGSYAGLSGRQAGLYDRLREGTERSRWSPLHVRSRHASPETCRWPIWARAVVGASWIAISTTAPQISAANPRRQLMTPIGPSNYGRTLSVP